MLLTVDIVADTPLSSESSPLFLLHDVATPLQTSPLTTSLASMEAKLCFTQASDALADLCHSLCMHAHLIGYKHQEVQGQRPNTRARALLDKAEVKINLAAERYRHAQQAYLKLVGPGDWQATLKVLLPNDICTMAEDEDDGRTKRTGPHEGHRRVLWIWMAPGVSTEDDSEMHEGTVADYIVL